MPSSSSAAEKLEILRQDISARSGVALVRASERPRTVVRGILATGVPALDGLLAGGLSRGALTEISGVGSCGRFTTALSVLAEATRAGESAVLIDLGDGLSPREAREAGTDLSRLLWVRPRRLKEAALAAEIALGAGFPLIVIEMGMPPLEGSRLPEAVWVRLSRGARLRGAALLVSSPYPVSGIAAEAAVALLRGRPMWASDGACPSLLSGMSARFALERRRGERPGARAGIEFSIAS